MREEAAIVCEATIAGEFLEASRARCPAGVIW